jgi:LytS/YehU family sensor histidine kinase
VENAIQHGITSRESGGALSVQAIVDEGTLVVTIEDDGVGIGNAPASHGSGLGLKSVRSRLRHLYGDQQQFDLRPRSPSGTTVMITLPYRPDGA